MSNLNQTTTSKESASLTFEDVAKMIEAWKNDHPEPAMEIISPQEYFRRLGYRKPIAPEMVARLMEEHRRI